MLMCGLDGLLLSAGAAIAHTYNIRPKQKLAQHTEDSEHQDQPPSAHTPPEPHGIPWSLNLFQHVIQENEKTQHRPQLVTVRVMVLPDGGFFSFGAVCGKIDPNKPTVTYRMLWPKTSHRGNRTPHHDQCTSLVSFTTANATHRNAARENPSIWIGRRISRDLRCPPVVVLEKTAQALVTLDG